MTTLDPSTLGAFVDGFFGYGSYSAPWWFIGMEEGGCDSFQELERRVRAWTLRGRRELEDLVDYHAAIAETRWFGDRPNLQKTWARLIAIVLAAEGREPENETIRTYQARGLARRRSQTCLLELLPLPARSIGSWPYHPVGELAYLRSRDAYRAEVLPRRMRHLAAKIREHRPRAVVAYGLSYAEHWARLSNNRLEEQRIDGMKARVGRVNGTPFLVVQHPAARGVTKRYFELVGLSLGHP